jgi:hypothetical protein
MKNPKQLITLTAVVAMCGVLLASCGGGSGGSTSKAEVINGITVPPEPDATLNAATLAGVDSNSNGVRDDVERKIADSFGSDKLKYESALTLAKAEQSLLSSGDKSAYASMLCDMSSGYTKELDAVTIYTSEGNSSRATTLRELSDVVIVRDSVTGRCSLEE